MDVRAWRGRLGGRRAPRTLAAPLDFGDARGACRGRRGRRGGGGWRRGAFGWEGRPVVRCRRWSHGDDSTHIEGKCDRERAEESVRVAGRKSCRRTLGAGPWPMFPRRTGLVLVLLSGTRTPLYSALALSRPFPGRVRERGSKVASGGYSAVTVRARWMLWTGAALECRTQELGAIVSESATILVSCRVAKGVRRRRAFWLLCLCAALGWSSHGCCLVRWNGWQTSEPWSSGQGLRRIGARHKNGLKNPSPIVWGAARKTCKCRRAGCWMLEAEQRARVRGGLRL